MDPFVMKMIRMQCTSLFYSNDLFFSWFPSACANRLRGKDRVRFGAFNGSVVQRNASNRRSVRRNQLYTRHKRILVLFHHQRDALHSGIQPHFIRNHLPSGGCRFG